MILREGKTEYLKSKFRMIPLPNESLYLLHGIIGTTFGVFISVDIDFQILRSQLQLH